MRARHWVGAILLYLVFVAASLPASVLLLAAQRVYPDRIAAEGLSGTVWHGHADRVAVASRNGATVGACALSWTVRLPRLLLGELAVDATLNGAAAGTVGMSMDMRGPDIRHVDATLPASWLGVLSSALALSEPEGSLSIRSDGFALHPGAYLGQGEVVWRRAASGLSPVRPLGDYRAAVSGAGSGIRLVLSTDAGPLELKGEGEWSPAAVKFSGTARALEQEAKLRRVLAMIGSPSPDGRYRITFGR